MASKTDLDEALERYHRTALRVRDREGGAAEERARIRKRLTASIESKKRQVAPTDRWYVSEQDLSAALYAVCPEGEEA